MFQLENVRFLDVIFVPNLTIEQGEVTCIVGGSGAGKSTLAKLLNKMITASSGTISYQDKNINELDPIELRREVVMLSQAPLMFDGTIEMNLQVGLKFANKTLATKEEMNEILVEMNLKKELTDDVDKLSGGEKQRIALARVALMKPYVYILDEPTSALDDITEEEVIHKFLEHAKREGKTVIIITHSKTLAKEFSDTIITLKDGEIV